MKKLIFLFCAIILPGAGLFVQAQSFFNNKGQDEDLSLYIGESKVIAANTPSRISITDPEILDIPTATEKEIIVIGKNKGRTTFSYVDKSGEHIYTVRVISEDIQYLKNRVDAVLKTLVLPHVYTKEMEEEGKILILGTINSIDAKERMKTALGDLYKKVNDLTEVEEDALIDISVEVVELSSGAQRDLGINWPTNVTLSEPTNRLAWQTLSGLPDALFRVADWTRAPSSEVTIDLLVQEGKAKILSRPRVVCQSGKEAELLVGGEVPVFNTSTSTEGTASSTSVEYKEYGIKLKIGPKIVADGRVQLSLKIDISELDGLESSGNAKAHPMSKRSISTQLYLNDGETLAIGGLIKQKSSEVLKRVPWLSDVPVLGMFFRSRALDSGGAVGGKENTELLVTLTPKIIKTANKDIKSNFDVKPASIIPAEETLKDSTIPKEMQKYILDVQKNISTHSKYPAELLGTGWRGDLIMRLVISPAGDLKNAVLIKSSGYKIFDDEALSLVKNLTYPPFFSSANLEEITIDIPLVYQEKNNG